MSKTPVRRGFLFYNLTMFNLVPPVFAANPAVWTGECVGSGPGGDVATITGIQCLIANILRPAPALLAFAAVAMVIFAGTRLVMAGSDTKAYAAAWSTFTYAVLGVVLLAVAWLALIFIQNFTGAQVTQFGVSIQ